MGDVGISWFRSVEVWELPAEYVGSARCLMSIEDG